MIRPPEDNEELTKALVGAYEDAERAALDELELWVTRMKWAFVFLVLGIFGTVYGMLVTNALVVMVSLQVGVVAYATAKLWILPRGDATVARWKQLRQFDPMGLGSGED